MTSSLVGSARVEITGDLTEFAGTVEEQIKTVMANLGITIDEGLAPTAGTFGEAGAKAGTAFTGGVADTSKSAGAAIDASAVEAGESGRAAYAELGASCGAAMAEGMTGAIEAGSTGVAASVEGDAVKAGEAGRASFAEAGAKAGEAFTESAKEAAHGLSGALVGGIATLGVGEVVKSAVEAGDQLEGANLKIEHIFGESADAVESWAKSLAGSFGISEAAGETLAGSFAQILIPLGEGPAESAAMSEKLTELTADMARYNNVSQDTVQSALISGLRGRATALRSLGVDISNTTIAEYAYSNGLAKQGAVLTDAQKTQAAYALILQQTAKQQGATAASAGTLAQKKQVLDATVKNLTADLGLKLFPILAKIAGYLLNDVVPVIGDVGHWIQQNSAWLGPLVLILGGAALAYKSVALATGLATKAWSAATTVAGLFTSTSDEQAVAQAQVGLATTANTEAADALTVAQGAAADAIATNGASSAEATTALAALAIAEDDAAAAAEALATAVEGVDVAMDANPIGVVVGAIAAGAIALHLLGGNAKAAIKPTEDLTNAIKADGDAIGAQTKAIINQKLENDGLYDAGLKLGIQQTTLLSAAMGNAAAQAYVAAVISGQLIPTIKASNGFNEKSAAAWVRLTGAQGSTASAAVKLKDGLDGLSTTLAVNQTAAENESKALGDVTTSSSALDIQTAQAKANLVAYTDQIKREITLLGTLGQAQLAAAKSEDAFKDSVAGVTASVKTNGDSLSDNTAKGRANRGAIEDSLSAALSYAQAQQANGVAISTVSTTLANNVKQLEQSAIKAGLSKTAVHDLIAEMKLTPKNILTDFNIHVQADAALAASTKGHGTSAHATGGKLGLGWNVVGEMGPEPIFNDGSSQTVFPTGSGMLGNDVKQASPFTDEDKALLWALANRPQILQVDSVAIARANNTGQRRLGRQM